MFTSKPRLRRLIASWLLVQTGTQLVWPSISYALTAGPTAPEATSFEPVDTTDMVNLLSGDLTYNIPLLEVPGPEGGYPLSLAYHAGIQPDVEASWVGLGWSLNPGAIARNVNGYADDQKDASSVTHDYWQGGQTTTYSAGVSVGLGQAASVSAGLSFSNDTYKGFGVGGYVGAGVALGPWSNKSPIGVSGRLSIDGYGNTGAGVSIGVATKGAVSLGASVGLSTNFSSVSASAGAGVSAFGNSLLGASINSSNGKFSLTGVGGSSGTRNDNAGRIQTQSDGFSVDIPVYAGVFISLGYDYTRYWSDETDVSTVNGALYYPTTFTANPVNNTSGAPFDNVAFDTYRVLDPEHENIYDNPDPDWLRGGSFPDYDNYNVVAQGLSGSMRPYAFQECLYSRNRRDRDSQGNYSRAISTVPVMALVYNKPMQFRFENDFSNSYRQENGAININPALGPFASFQLSPTYGNSDGDAGYDPTTNRLEGSKHIDYFTNTNILSSTGHPGFVDTDARGFNRQAAVTAHPELANQIGGFSITNTSGVTYHFALPVYAYDEYTRSQSTASGQSNTYNESTKASYYAYTWYLTAITGPDYVDRGTAGLSSDDWGYWVKFNYGLWTDHYGWRNPAVGYQSDVDAEVKTYSRGKKEVYYLNSIATRSHTALFEKEIRLDGKGVTGGLFRGTTATCSPGSFPADGYSWWTVIDNGFSNITNQDINIRNPRANPFNPPVWKAYNVSENVATSLRLNKVYLLQNADVPPNIESASTRYDLQSTTSTGYTTTNSIPNCYPIVNLIGQGGSNVFDSEDAKSIAATLSATLSQKSIRVIDFTYDYSLAPNTPNSFGSSGGLTGKLTLKQLAFKGAGNSSLLPPTKFGYELAGEERQEVAIQLLRNASGNFADGQVGTVQMPSSALGKIIIGDILQFKDANTTHYFTVLDLAGLSPVQFKVRYLDDIGGINLANFTAVTTKNPPYSADKRDWWGMYKSDFNEDFIGFAESIGRRTTAVSNRGTDVWSLRRVSSPLGTTINIGYEGDQYRKAVLERPDLIAEVETRWDQVNSTYISYLTTKFTTAQLKSLFKVGDIIYVNGMLQSLTGPGNCRTYVPKTEIPVRIDALEDTPLTAAGYAGYGIIRISRPLSIPTDPANYSFISYGGSIYGAYISLPKQNTTNQGGGLRVKTIALTSNGTKQTTSYEYTRNYSSTYAQNALLPSGVTSYEPGNFLQLAKRIGSASGSCEQPNAANIQLYKDQYTKSLPYIFAVSRHIPAPGIMYEAVTVRENRTQADGTAIEAPNSWVYRFQVFQENMIGHKVDPSNLGGVPNNYTYYGSQVSVKDFTSRIGSLLSTTRYGANGKKLSETVTHYLHDGLNNASYDENASAASTGYQALLAPFNYQGVIQESFADCRDCSAGNGRYDRKMVMTKRDVYPTIPTSTTTKDFATGTSTTTSTLGYDFYSGVATRTLSDDGYGNRFETETVPAYRYYPAMGLKVGGSARKHMLSQPATSTTYKVNASNTRLAVVSASAQTWSDQVGVIGQDANAPESISPQTGVWRPWQNFSWLPTGTTTDGLTPLTGSNSFVGYDYASASPTLPWRKTNETTLYNVYSNALEAKDMQNVYLATKLGFDQSKVLVSGGPAAYQELAYSGAEENKAAGDYFSGAVALTWAPDGSGNTAGGPGGSGGVYRDAAHAHTGKWGLHVDPYKHGFSYSANANNTTANTFCLDLNKSYRASVWVNDAAGQLYYWVDNRQVAIVSTSVQKQTADGWYLLEVTIPPLATIPLSGTATTHSSLRVGCYNNGNTSQGICFDDFRVQPVNAQASAYVYDEQTGQVSYILDNSNLFTHYEYDLGGRLKRVSRETLQFGAQKVAEYSHHLTGVLNNARLDVTDGQAVVTVAVDEQLTIQYDLGDNNGYRTLSTATWPYTFSCWNSQGAPVGQWVKVKIRDSQGNIRELVKRLY